MNPLSWFDSELIGTGPYHLVNRDLRAGTVLIEAVNPVHQGKYRQIFFTSVSDPKQRAELIHSGEAQISLNPNPATVQDLLNKNLQVQEAPTKNLAFLVFHSSISQEVRRAISNGIDRQKIVRWVFAGRGRASGSVMDPTLLPKKLSRA